MNGNESVSAYLARCARRLVWLVRIRLVAVGIVVTALLSIAFAVLAAYAVPSQAGVVAARVVLYALAGGMLIAVFLRRIGVAKVVRRVERRVPAFGGRLSTWFDSSRRPAPPALLPQLAADVAVVATRNPPWEALPRQLFAVPVGIAMLALGLLAWFLLAAPQHLRLPAERLWLGDAMTDTRPRILVEPGDAVVSRGTDVLVRARVRGFAADELRMHATFAGAADWELADMLPAAETRHEFVMVAVTDAVDYFVSAGGVNSDRFRIEVADLPVVTGIDVTLEFPAWTRLETRHQDHGDVAGVIGTQVNAQVTAERPLPAAQLVVNGETVELDGEGRAGFAVEEHGTWHVAAEHRGDLVRISESFLIDVIEDQPPEVEFAFPGHDRSASVIEEVALRFRARDDFGVEALDLHYAINGGEWVVQPAGLTVGERDALSHHLLYFEDLVAADGRAIRPGDVVSFFAEARDHGQTARSALYFVDARPFDKRYRQRAGSGSGAGGGGGGDGLELSARQRDIASATWNLIRERDEGTRMGDDLRDQVDVVAILQGTLKGQVETLIARSESRRLSVDEEVESFVEELKQAVVAMQIAADTLAAHDLDAAVTPEQRALQHLLTAEASLRDIDVSLSRGESSGDAVSRSLSELADLELDPTRNRYETPESPNFGAAEESDDSDWERLTELARRHEELARRRERGEAQEAPLSRWQLERLKRELESLRERLSDAKAGQSRSQRQRDGSEPGAADLENAIADIDRAINEADADADRRREAETAALRGGAAALRDGVDQLRQRDVDQLAGQLRRAERDAAALLADHRRIGERLEALQNELLRATRAGERQRYREYGLADEAVTKRRMQDDLTRISADLADVREQLERVPDAGPAAARQVDRALDGLARSRINERLGLAAEYFEMGSPLFVIGQEGRIGTALEEFQERLDRAAGRIEGLQGRVQDGTTIDDVQRLRRRLQEIGQGGDAGTLREIAATARRMASEAERTAGAFDLAAMRARYRGLGADEQNRERLYRMTLAELDRLEISLGKVDGAAVRAPQPRDDGYDSRAVARYFRQLSCEEC